MRWLIIFVLALLAAVGLSVLLKNETGYVMLTWGEWTIETSLALFVLVLSALFVAAYLTVRMLLSLWHVPRGASRWNIQRRQKKSQSTTLRGQVEMVEGQWQSAEKHFLQHIDSSDAQLQSYLGAAQAAQQQGAIERRDQYLQLAYNDDKKSAIAVQLTQAELQLAEGQPDQALQTLTYLKTVAPKHPRVLTQLAQVYEQQGLWGELRDMLSVIRRRHIFTDDDYKSLERKVYSGLLDITAQSGSSKQLKKDWDSLPREMRSDPALVYSYATALAEHNMGADAEAILRSTLRKQWAPELVRLYGQVEGANVERQLSVAESWLESNPKDADLLLTLGRLALRSQLWDKARGYLESTLAITPSAAACQELAGLLDQMGEQSRAVEYYREGMRLALNKPGKGITQAATIIAAPATTEEFPQPASLPSTT